jgi:hypothetical protein
MTSSQSGMGRKSSLSNSLGDSHSADLPVVNFLSNGPSEAVILLKYC